ncbi:hypothetical protein ATANTOWER_024863 [Ataeniobius toweri]|uniref:Uncharacterized protein n=1 Tax=Ataeniobius toweri TaxID=208326 RepID=A0ABU7BT80_9TELE|nr:hypothetical protein [Ataeniobius toweri]
MTAADEQKKVNSRKEQSNLLAKTNKTCWATEDGANLRLKIPCIVIQDGQTTAPCNSAKLKRLEILKKMAAVYCTITRCSTSSSPVKQVFDCRLYKIRQLR